MSYTISNILDMFADGQDQVIESYTKTFSSRKITDEGDEQLVGERASTKDNRRYLQYMCFL